MITSAPEQANPVGHSAGGPPAGPTPPETATAIELVRITKRFGTGSRAVAAVDDVNLVIREGEFFSLLGPSGCGKTTTLRMIGGFEQPTGGEILLHGKDVVGTPPNKRDVNMVFQSYALFPHMSVFENVAFGLRRKAVAGSEVKRRVGEMLELVQLQGKDRRRPSQLSGGQQQRVALARALINRPRALLLDEPLAALDLKLRQTMQIELKSIQREVGITFVFVTHDQNEALTMSDRLVVMNEGHIEQVGSPREMYERPRTRFVAGFIGTSNLMTRSIASMDGTTAILECGAGERFVVRDAAALGAVPGGKIDVTVRPEKITLGTEPAGGEMCSLRATVTNVVYMGAWTQYAVRLADGAELTVFIQNATNSEDAAERGAEVWLGWDPAHSLAVAPQ